MGRINKDAEYLPKLQAVYAREGAIPPYSHLAELLGFRTKTAVTKLVERLVRAHYLHRNAGRRLVPGELFFQRALVQSVPAGKPESTELACELVSIDSYLVDSPQSSILVRVKGNSMVDAGVNDGDIVVVDKRLQAAKGDLVVVVVDGELTLKELDFENENPILRARNVAHADIRPSNELHIIGVVVGQFRKYGRHRRKGKVAPKEKR